MLKWLSEGSRLLAVAIIFAMFATAQAQSQPDKSITLIVEPDLSLRLGSYVVTRDGLIAALEAATNGDQTNVKIVATSNVVWESHGYFPANFM